jgi:hypothetical protein
MARCKSEIKKFISTLPPGQLFSTLQIFLCSPAGHSRNSINQALAKMVNEGTLERITSGVFVDSNTKKDTYTHVEIISAKAAIKNVASQNQYRDGIEATLLSSESRIRFRHLGEYVVVKKVSVKKMKLAESMVGLTILSLMQKGKDTCNLDEIARAISTLTRKELAEFIALRQYMPTWFSTRAKEAIGPKWSKIERELKQQTSQQLKCQSRQPVKRN